MFAPYLVNAWLAGTAVAVLAGAIGVFVVAKGRTFPAHAIPNGAFAGAAGAGLIGVSASTGLTVFSIVSAIGIASTSRRTRSDAATALWLVGMLALGSLFLSLSGSYEGSLNALLFGDVLGVSVDQVIRAIVLCVLGLAAVAVLARPLALSAISDELAEARHTRARGLEFALLIMLAIFSSVAVPIVGALLTFTLTVSPAATAMVICRRPLRALACSVGVAVVTMWTAILLSWSTNWPTGFFVGTLGALGYLAARSFRARVRPVVRPR